MLFSSFSKEQVDANVNQRGTLTSEQLCSFTKPKKLSKVCLWFDPAFLKGLQNLYSGLDSS